MQNSIPMQPVQSNDKLPNKSLHPLSANLFFPFLFRPSFRFSLFPTTFTRLFGSHVSKNTTTLPIVARIFDFTKRETSWLIRASVKQSVSCRMQLEEPSVRKSDRTYCGICKVRVWTVWQLITDNIISSTRRLSLISLPKSHLVIQRHKAWKKVYRVKFNWKNRVFSNWSKRIVWFLNWG